MLSLASRAYALLRAPRAYIEERVPVLNYQSECNPSRFCVCKILEVGGRVDPFTSLEKFMDLDRDDRNSKKLLITHWRSILLEEWRSSCPFESHPRNDNQHSR